MRGICAVGRRARYRARDGSIGEVGAVAATGAAPVVCCWPVDRSPCDATYLSLVNTSIDLIFSIDFGGIGSFGAPIASNLSRVLMSPSICPNTEYCRSRKLEVAKQTKNWQPALFGSLVRAADSVPRTCGLSLNSALIL